MPITGEIPSRPGRRGRRLTIWELMLLIAGVAVGLGLFAGEWKRQDAMGSLGGWLIVTAGVLGGLSLVGPPLLLGERFRNRNRPWRAGKILWFAQGMASWLLWPPVVYRRVARGPEAGVGMSGTCYAYGTPLMALYVT